MAKILVVDDNEYFLNTVAKFLRLKKHEVVIAPNGKVAREILVFDKFDLILSDIQMPFLNGVELLKWTKENHPTPFILMTGFSNIMETKAAYELGAREFLSKPFKNEELFAAVDSILAPSTSVVHLPPKNEDLDADYRKVSIEEFVAKSKIDFDVYVRLSKAKYVKIGHAGQSIPAQQILTYKTKGLSHLHIKKEDFGKLLDFNMDLSKIIAKTDMISQQKKLNFMKYTGEILLERVFYDGVDKETYDDAKEFLTTTVSIITNSKENIDLIESLNAHSDFVYAHSIGVAMFALMIGRKLGISTQQSFFKLSMAGLFHDIGKKEIPREILEKSRPLLSQQERSLLETHSTRSMEILSILKNVPNDVIQMVAEHHEDNVGRGYPKRLNKNTLHPLSKILIVANLFAEAAIKGPIHPGMSPQDAIEYIERIYEDRLDKPCLTALRDIFCKGAKAVVNQ